MQDSQDKILGRLVLQRGLMSEEHARRCLEESTRQGQSFLAVASAHRLLTDQQSQQIWAEYQRYQHSAWSAEQSTAQGTRVVPIEARGQIQSDSGLANSQLRSTTADKDGLPSIGESIDGYEVISLLGKGGMGAVYRVRKDSKDYALKVILTENDTALARFEREAQAAAAVDIHENIVRIFRYSQHNGRWYILSDFVKGCGLDEFLVEGEPLELERTLEIMTKVADAVDFIHQKGILHRDLKPANILIRGSDQEPLITDFGLARLADSETLTKSQDFLGTPGYMAPEQAGSEHKQVGPASDIWALGVILYQLTTGQRPFQGESAVELITKILMGDPEKPTLLNGELPRDVETIIFKALEKEIPDRYLSAGDFAKDCAAVLKGESIIATRMGRIGRAKRQLKRRFGRAMPIVVLLTVTVIAVVPAAIWYQQSLARAEEAQAQREQSIRSLARSLKKLERESRNLLLASDLLGEKTREDVTAAKNALRELSNKTRNKSESGGDELQKEPEFRKVLKQIQFINWAMTSNPPNLEKTGLAANEITYLKAREQWHLGNWEKAKKGFLKLSEKGKGLRLIGHFGLGLSSLKLNSWKEAQLTFYEVDSNKLLAKLAIEALRNDLTLRVRRMLLKDKKTHALDRKRETDLFNALVNSLTQAGNSRMAWDQWNTSLQDAFYEKAKRSNWSTEEMVKRWQSIDKRRSLKHRFRPPNLNKDMLLYLARQSKTKADSLDYYLKARQLDTHFPLPKGFRPSEIAGEIMSLLLVKSDQKIEEAYEFMMVASSSGIYVPITRKIALPKFEEKGYFRKLYQLDSKNPLLYYWRGLLPPQYYQDNRKLTKAEIVSKLNRLNSDLTHAIKSEKLPSYYRAVALEKRVKAQQIIREYLDKAPAEPRKRWRVDLKKALVLQHPKPQLIYFQFWLWGENSEEKIKWAQRRLKAIQDRRLRTENETLGEGRPWECPIEILDQGSYKNQAMDAYIKLSESYREAQLYDEAVTAARTGLSIQPSSGYALTRYGEVLLLNKDGEEFERAFRDYKRRFGFNQSLKNQFDHFLKTKKARPN